MLDHRPVHRVLGWCRPGVSTKTICPRSPRWQHAEDAAARRLQTSATAAMLLPTRRLSRVDLPTLVQPNRATEPGPRRPRPAPRVAHAARRNPSAPAGRTRTRWTRRRSASTTSMLRPRVPASRRLPGPGRAWTRRAPPRCRSRARSTRRRTASPAPPRAPRRRRATSRRCSWRTAPPPSRARPGCRPTISSSTSSSVTSPATPPYSSTTIATCVRTRISRQQLGDRQRLGHEHHLAHVAAIGRRPRAPPPRRATGRARGARRRRRRSSAVDGHARVASAISAPRASATWSLAAGRRCPRAAS